MIICLWSCDVDKSTETMVKLQQDFLIQYRVRVVMYNRFCAMRQDGLCDLLIT